MKKIILILIFFMLSCSKAVKNKTDCNENIKFKHDFFKRINYLEKYIFSYQDSVFKNSLIFISNYAPVSFHETINYARIYNISVLEKDKLIWIKWYENNKCKNIQHKKSYPIPEQYKEFFE